MDDYKPYTSSTDQLPLPLHALRRRAVPDVPEDVDFLMDHLNDPNFDLKKPLLDSAETVKLDTLPKRKSRYADTDVESNASHPSRTSAPSRTSTAVEFNE
jgi:hypothetical protein